MAARMESPRQHHRFIVVLVYRGYIYSIFTRNRQGLPEPIDSIVKLQYIQLTVGFNIFQQQYSMFPFFSTSGEACSDKGFVVNFIFFSFGFGPLYTQPVIWRQTVFSVSQALNKCVTLSTQDTCNQKWEDKCIEKRHIPYIKVISNMNVASASLQSVNILCQNIFLVCLKKKKNVLAFSWAVRIKQYKSTFSFFPRN